jgi:hypothetical protein
MPWHDDLGMHRSGPSDCLVKVIDFKQEEHAVAVGLVVWVLSGRDDARPQSGATA